MKSLHVLLLCFSLGLCAYDSKAASPVSKVWQKADFQSCPEGVRAHRCFRTSHIRLTWDHAYLREDASTLRLEDIGYYVITYSRDGGLQRTLNVGKDTTRTLKFMPAGTYTFRIGTVDKAGIQGNFSNPISITVN